MVISVSGHQKFIAITGVIKMNQENVSLVLYFFSTRKSELFHFVIINLIFKYYLLFLSIFIFLPISEHIRNKYPSSL